MCGKCKCSKGTCGSKSFRRSIVDAKNRTYAKEKELKRFFIPAHIVLGGIVILMIITMLAITPGAV